MPARKRKQRCCSLKVLNATDGELLKTPHQGEIRKIINYEHATIVHIELKPGESLKKHVTPVDVCFYVLDGEGHVIIGEEEAIVVKDQLVFSPARVPHKLLNASRPLKRRSSDLDPIPHILNFDEL
jgi:mannose-6-phosphate isomerase-like protein (cupin superfamily)